LQGCGNSQDGSSSSKSGKSRDASSASSSSSSGSDRFSSKTSSGKSTESKSSEKSDSSSKAETTESTPEDERAAGIESGKYDPIVVNEGVENAVKAGNTETASVSGYYGFTYSGFDKVYSNEELEKCFDRIQEICNSSYFSMGFSYKNIETGAYVGYNQNSKFLTCSTIKAPYIKSILQDGIDLDTVITRDYTWSGDDGTVASAPYGQKYTAKQLIEYTIDESDNTAYYLLFNTFGHTTFNNTLASLGATYSLTDYWIFTYCTSDDMMKCYEDIYNFGESNKYGEWLINLLSDTDLNIQIGKALGGKYKVAQKYGSEFNSVVFNDCAIVYADSPFVLTIFTNQYPETEESCEVFKELAVVFDDINTLIASD
jgi:hypothetical protein